MKIYFAGSIRSGREKIDDYVKIVKLLKEYGTVLTEHVADPNLSSKGENDMTPEKIYIRDVNWLKESDIVIAEVTLPSLGVGYELAYAESIGKRIVCLYEQDKNLSAMIKGNKNFEIIAYANIEELLEKLKGILEI